jgi:hypothetical protein
MLGADPELFLVESSTGRFISSVGLIGGSKEFPLPIGEGCAVQEDNVAVEFNIPPCKTADDFVKYINYNLTYLTQKAGEMGLELYIKPSANFDEEQLSSPAAQAFGCEPDYNAWTGLPNPRPTCEDATLRSAGGHIHIGCDKEQSLSIIKAMDLFVGCPLLRHDNDEKRRLLYGKAGAFRYKPYGVEYRTASNVWISSEHLIRWVWSQTQRAVEWVKEGNKFTKEQGKLIQDCINTNNIDLLSVLEKEFPIYG